HDALVARQTLQPHDVALLPGPQRLLDQHVLAVLEAVGEHLDLRFIGDTGEHRVIVRERHVGDGAIARLVVDRIHRRDEVPTSDPATFMPLNPEARDHDPHRRTAQTGAICRSSVSIFERRSSAVTGTLPSHSHSTAAAMVPRMVEMPGLPTASMASVAEASSASRAPTASPSRSTKLSITKKLSRDS